jgi:hypothetical protein
LDEKITFETNVVLKCGSVEESLTLIVLSTFALIFILKAFEFVNEVFFIFVVFGVQALVFFSDFFQLFLEIEVGIGILIWSQ